jgi:hypothetical protein
LDPNFDFFKINKNLYIGPVCIADLDCRLHDQEK